MTLVTGNNTQEALLSRSRCESDQEVRDDRVEPGFQSKCLYPVVTGCEEMDWSHVSHILTPLTPLHLCSFSCSSTFTYFRCRLGGWRWEGQRGHWGRSDGASLSSGGGKSVKHLLYKTESGGGGGGAQWRLRGSPDSGMGDISQFTLGVQERTEVCVCVCVCVCVRARVRWGRGGGSTCSPGRGWEASTVSQKL